jgi:hypothetical protein
MENFDQLLEAYIEELKTKHSEEVKRDLPTLHERYNGEYNKFSFTTGKRFVKVLNRTTGETSGSVHCFIELANGNIHKPGSWSAPQPNGIRGNLANERRPIFSRDFYAKKGLTR